jgi:hypothetical protein
MTTRLRRRAKVYERLRNNRRSPFLKTYDELVAGERLPYFSPRPEDYERAAAEEDARFAKDGYGIEALAPENEFTRFIMPRTESKS